MRAPLLLGWLLALAALLALVADRGVTEDQPDTYWDFEEPSDGEGWLTVGGDLRLEAGRGVDGTTAVSITVEELAGVRAVHPVAIIQGGSYQLSGQFVATDPPIDWVELRLALYEADGSLLDRLSAGRLEGPSTWSAGPFPLNCEPARGQLEIIVSGDPSSTVFLDNLGLKGSPPATPCPSPTPMPSSTATPSATPIVTPTLSTSPSPTVTPMPSPTATPTPSSTATPTPTVTLTPSHGLLVNGGFEAAEDGRPVAWRTQGGVLTQASEPVHGGRFAGRFASATESTKWLYQAVAVTPTAWYELEAYIYHDDPQVEAALLRISWYTSPDASGSAVSTVDSMAQLEEPEGRYRYLTTGPVQAPPGVRSAKVRILLRPRSAATAVIYIDDVSFSPAAPPTVTPTPSPSATPTLTPTPTPTPTVPPTPSATVPPTPTVSPTPTPAAPPLSTRSPTPPATAAAVSTPGALATPTPAGGSSDARETPGLPGPTPTASRGLLVNGGFEAAEDGRPVAWRTQGGVLTQTDAPSHSGRFAAGFTSFTDSTKWLYQTVAVTPAAWYELDAYVYHNDPRVEAALLRISWYVSTDASGSAVATIDSTSQLEEPEDRYRYLTTGPVLAPPGVRSAMVRVLLRPRSAVSALIYIDDVSFRPTVPAPVESDPAEETNAGGAQTSRPPGSSSGSRPDSRVSSEVLGASQSGKAASFTPMPTPVIRRSSRLQTEGDPASSGGGLLWWPWALAGGGVVMGGIAWASYRWGRIS